MTRTLFRGSLSQCGHGNSPGRGKAWGSAYLPPALKNTMKKKTSKKTIRIMSNGIVIVRR